LGSVLTILLIIGLGVAAVVSDDQEQPLSASSSTVSTAAPTTASSRTLRTVPPSVRARHFRTGARCRDGWRSGATGSGACAWHGGVADWLYADDRIVHETRTGREIGERDRSQFVFSCQLGGNRTRPGPSMYV
jgi:hypothetical protein